MADDLLRSDEIRDLINENMSDSEIDWDDIAQPSTSAVSDFNLDSDHASDIDLDSDGVDEDDSGENDVPDNLKPMPSGGEWRKWRANDVSFPEFKHVMGDNCGFKPPPNINRQSEIEFFQLFFTDQLFLEIVNESNRYAREKIQDNTPLSKNSSWNSWIDITMPELKAFIGVILNMSLNPKPSIDDYFSLNWLDYQPFFKDIFSKQRFYQIFWSLHINPPHNTGPILGTLTRSGKVKRFLKYLEQKFQEYFVPSKNVSVDESTIGF